MSEATIAAMLVNLVLLVASAEVLMIRGTGALLAALWWFLRTGETPW